MQASNDFVERYYSEYVAERDTIEGRWARQFLKDVLGRHVLNVGCGPQFFDDAIEFPTIPDELIGIDINEANIDFLRVRPGTSSWITKFSQHEAD